MISCYNKGRLIFSPIRLGRSAFNDLPLVRSVLNQSAIQLFARNDLNIIGR